MTNKVGNLSTPFHFSAIIASVFDMPQCEFLSFHSASFLSQRYNERQLQNSLTNTTLPGCADGAQLGCKFISCDWSIGITYLKTDGNSFGTREINKVTRGITVIALKGTVNIASIAEWFSGKLVAAAIVCLPGNQIKYCLQNILLPNRLVIAS